MPRHRTQGLASGTVTSPQPPVGYIMSRFPKISETFIMNEMLELERLGVRIEIFPLKLEREDVRHPEAEELARRAHWVSPVSREIARAQVAWLRAAPARSLGIWWTVLSRSARSPAVLIRSLYVMTLAAWFARTMRSYGVQHVHAHYATYPALAAFVVSELTGIPFSFTAHAHDIYVDRTMLGDKLRAARFVVTVSGYNRALLQSLYGGAADRVHVVRCGVDPEFFTPPPRAPYAERPLTILSVASLEPYKGHRHLLAACAWLGQAGVALRCVLVGDGDERPRLEAEARRLGLEDTVTFRGRQPREVVRTLLWEADVFALASITTPQGKTEGLPVALMEALACGVPAVATDVSGVSELVVDGQTGLLVPPGDAPALAEALRRLAEDPALRERLGAAGRAKILEDYDLRRNVRALRALLTRLA